jgi:hypothetical protein
VAPSRRLHRSQVQDGRVDAMACLSDLFSSPLQSPPGAQFHFLVDLQVATCMVDLRL